MFLTGVHSEFKKNSVIASNNRNGNYFLKNIINRLENFFWIIYNNHRNNFQKRRIKEKVI